MSKVKLLNNKEVDYDTLDLNNLSKDELLYIAAQRTKVQIKILDEGFTLKSLDKEKESE